MGGIIADMPATPQEATESPQGYAVSASSGERKNCVRGALPLDAIDLVLSRHVEAVYNLLRAAEVRVCADTPDTE